MRIIVIMIFFVAAKPIVAQSKVSIIGGWTAAKVRTVYDKNITKGPAFKEAATMPVLHSPYFGVEYEYDYKKLHLSTGLTVLTLGSNRMPFFGEIPWPTYYWAFPFLGGYTINLAQQWSMVVEGGTEICFQQGNSGFIGAGSYWGNINAVAGIEVAYARFRLGVKLQWGLTDFRILYPITYKHTGLTTYLGYTLWDHAKSKAKRLKKQQEKQLE